MKKALLLLLVFSTAAMADYAQSPSISKVTAKAKGAPELPYGDNRSVYFDGYQNDSDFGMNNSLLGVMDTRVFDIFDQVNVSPNLKEWNKAHPKRIIYPFTPKTKIMLGVNFSAKKGTYSTYHTNSLSKDYIAYKFADGDSVTAIAMGINAGNVNDYKYHVVANDSTELVPWTTPKLQQQFGAKKAYGFFGKFHAPGKEIIVEVVNVKDYYVRDGVIFNWRNNLKPVITNIQVFTRNGKMQQFDVEPGKPTKYARRFDKVTGAPLDFHFRADSLNSFNIRFKNHPTMGYDVYWVFYNEGLEYKNAIETNVRDSVFGVSAQYFQGVGKYALLIYPTGTKNKIQETRVAYEVYDPTSSPNKFSIQELLPYLTGALLLFIVYYFYNRRRLKKLDQQKEMANLKLGSVRAQLNPHFMFNALTSIQNLMNQKDSAGANHYLAKFADLTRQVLNATGRELISLEDELKIVNDYLQIEQLRFGFGYTVDVDKSINIANTEIPGMLMQPFIENAAKHGISGMADKGKIDIAIAKEQNNLVLIIADNGKGFDTQRTITQGFGLKLGRERVALLNQIYKTQPVGLQINSGTGGTTITITLTAWF